MPLASGRSHFDKYRGIIISVALFLLLDASVLLLNFYISFQIADDAVDVNLAGRQRMLSQRMTKALYALDSQFLSQGKIEQQTLDELRASTNLFDRTLIAFRDGGTTSNASGGEVQLASVSDAAAILALKSASSRWQSYYAALDQVDASLDASLLRNVLNNALQQANEHNLALLKLMNDLTVALENVATSKANRLRLIQTVGISLAILNFLFILLHFVRQLRESDEVIEQARNETLEILDTVNEGLFLVDRDLIIGGQYSTQLEDILGRKNLAGENFQSILNEMINSKEASTTAEFIELLFSPKVKEKLIGDLNPLNEVEVNVLEDGINPVTRILSFSFSRAVVDNEIMHVLVTVSDITERITLARELSEAKEETERQVSLLTSILHTSPSLLQEFIANAFASYTRINEVLKSPGKTASAMLQKLNHIFMHVHTFKGEASALQLDNFVEHAHRFEDAITELKQRRELTGNDFLTLTVYLDELMSYTQQISNLANRMASFAVTREIEPSAGFEYWQPLQQLAEQIAAKYGKSLQLVISGLDSLALNDELKSGLKRTLMQCVRNSVIHGIEDADSRIAAQKPTQGRIDIRAAKLADGRVEVVIRDDGAGINYEALRERALESERWTETEIEGWDHKRLLSLMFQPDISTASELSEDAGRGMGMPAVLEWVNSHRGRLQVATRAGLYTRFTITLDLAEENRQAA